MDGPKDYHPKWSKSERERQILYDIIYMWNLKYDTNDHIYKIETDAQTQKTDLCLLRGRRVGEEYSVSLGVADANFYI